MELTIVTGDIVEGDSFPLTTDSIFASVVVEDINDDGKMEIIVTDTNANVSYCSNTINNCN